MKVNIDRIFDEYSGEMGNHSKFIEETIGDFVAKISRKLSEIEIYEFENIEPRPEAVSDLLNKLRLNSPLRHNVQKFIESEIDYSDDYSPPPRLPSFSDPLSSPEQNPTTSPVNISTSCRKTPDIVEISESENDHDDRESDQDEDDSPPNEVEDLDLLLYKAIKSIDDIHLSILLYRPLLLCKSLTVIRESSLQLAKLSKKQLRSYFDRHGISHVDEETSGWGRARIKQSSKSKKRK